MPPRKIQPQLATALRHFAWRMTDDPNAYSKHEGKAMDRALRSCPGISDIDRVWVRWRYVAEKQGWLTVEEMVLKKGRYEYPIDTEEETRCCEAHEGVRPYRTTSEDEP